MQMRRGVVLTQTGVVQTRIVVALFVLISIVFLLSRRAGPPSASVNMTEENSSVGGAFHITTTALATHDGTKHQLLLADGNPVTYQQALKLMQESEEVRSLLTSVIASSEYAALFWECVPVTADTIAAQAFEFVLINSRALASKQADESPFREHFSSCAPDALVCSFMNIGRDALLVVPTPDRSVDSRSFAHVASFVRSAASEQVHALWREVGKAMEVRVEERGSSSTWMSTSGLGVFWLHIRLDSRPKYYTYSPYRS